VGRKSLLLLVRRAGEIHGLWPWVWTTKPQPKIDENALARPFGPVPAGVFAWRRAQSLSVCFAYESHR